MSEEEIIEGITNIIYTCNDVIEDKEWYDQEEIESAKEQLKFTESLLDLYNEEKEKNKKQKKEIVELEKYMKTNLIPKSTINLLYISKDKIREKKRILLKKGKEMNEAERQKQTEFMQGKLKAYEELLEEN